MPTPRLPVPGSDDGTWGDLLNTYLEVEHAADGTLIRGAEFAAKYDKPSGGIPSTDLASNVQTNLSKAVSAVQPIGATMTGDLIFPSTGFIMTDDTSQQWRITIDASGTIITTLIGGVAISTLIMGGFNSAHIITQGFI